MAYVKSTMMLIVFLISISIEAREYKYPTLPQQEVTQPNKNDHLKAKTISNIFECEEIPPIHLAVDSGGITNKSGNDSLPETLVYLLKSTLASYGLKNIILYNDFNVWMNTAAFKFVKEKEIVTTDYDDLNEEQQIKRKKAFLIQGAITAFDNNNKEMGSNSNLGINFGGGKGLTSSNNGWDNSSDVSSLTLYLELNQEEVPMYSVTGEIKIYRTKKSFGFGLSIGDTSIGKNGYTQIRNGLGESLRKLMYAAISNLAMQIIEDDLEGKPINKACLANGCFYKGGCDDYPNEMNSAINRKEEILRKQNEVLESLRRNRAKREK
jgi:hypothetical protein